MKDTEALTYGQTLFLRQFLIQYNQDVAPQTIDASDVQSLKVRLPNTTEKSRVLCARFLVVAQHSGREPRRINSARLPAWFVEAPVLQGGAFVPLVHRAWAGLWLSLRFVSIFKLW
jgi:hypothetical protein